MESNSLRFKDWILDKYDHETACFLTWLNSFEYMCKILNKSYDERTNCLLNMIRPSDYGIIKEGFSQIDNVDLPYDRIIAMLIKIYTYVTEKKAADIRCKNRIQLPYETIKHYDFALRELLFKCTTAFKNSVNLTSVFIEGLADVEIKTFLEGNKEISYTMAVQTAEKMEFAKFQKLGESSSK